MVWDDPGNCQHGWGGWQEKHDVRAEKITAGKSRTTDRYCGDDKTRRFNGNHQKHTAGQFCQLCNAWRGSLGLEPTPELFIDHVVQIFREVRRVLRKDGTAWLNLGDSYSAGTRDYNSFRRDRAHVCVPKIQKGCGLPPKNLLGIPWRVALALQADGWWLRSAMPWVKRSAMPESATDRPASALEYMFLLTKSQRYYFDMGAVRVEYTESLNRYGGDKKKLSENLKTESYHASAHRERDMRPNPSGRNFRNTDLFYQSIAPPYGAIFCGDEMVGLDVNPQAMKAAHFATFPENFVEPCILAGTSERGCCVECGSPWARVVEKAPVNMPETTLAAWQRGPGPHDKIPKGNYRGKHSGTDPQAAGSRISKNVKSARDAGGDHDNPFLPPKTIGWKPTCKCNAETKPCIVCDPFIGSGTTGIVAHRHGRNFVGVELSKSYLDDIAIPRIEKVTKQLKLFK